MTAGVLTLRFSTQAQVDIQRITRQLSDLQRQVASGAKANDLLGFGAGASRLISAQGLRAATDARAAALQQLEARFGVQAAALGQVASAAGTLSQSIREAISSNDGRAVGVELQLAFSSIITALNESWNGQPLFAGERIGPGPVKISSLDELLVALTPDQLFDEAERHQTLDLGVGEPIPLANKASEISIPLLSALRDLKQLVDSASGELPAPLTGTQRDQLQALAERVEAEIDTFNNAEGRAGQLEKRFVAERSRLLARSNLLVREVGEQADADLAMVAVQINSLVVQYEAAAKTFGDLSKLSLLQYL
jgi:flagellin-like hook-associated protein FlgL